ncbi:MAG: hypothetical protein ACK4WB_03105 [Desulfatiglandales bacterium]
MDLYEFMCTSCGISHHMEIGPANLGYAKDLQREVDLTRPCPNCGGELMVIGPKDLEPFYRTTPRAP